MKSIESASPTGRSRRGLLDRLPRVRVVTAAGFACLSLLLFSVAPALAQGAGVQSFLDLEGIRGESKTDGHKGEIETLGFGSGVELPPSTVGGAGTSKPQFYEITVSKRVDKASPLLFVNCATGKNFASATLTMSRVSASNTFDFFKIVLTNVKITRVAASGQTGGGGAVAEEVALSFEKIRWTVITLNAKGVATTTTGGFDLRTNTPF